MINIKTENEFNEQVLNSDVLTIVDFWAQWCGPCKAIVPILDQISKETNVKIVKVDVDENENLATKFQIRSIPTLMFFKNGKLQHQTVGSITKQNLQTILEKYI